ncbi:hypothetical protein ACFLX5_04775 [Chloroflexota bacterium]
MKSIRSEENRKGKPWESSMKNTLAGTYCQLPSVLLLAAASLSTAKSTNIPIENGGLTVA